MLDLHPRLSVVVGLDAHERERLLGVAAGIPAGSTGGARGLLEAHGVLLDLNDQNLALLELTEQRATVLGASDVPGARDPGELRLAAERYLLSWPVGRHPRLDTTRAAYETAKQSCDTLRSEAAEARETLHRASADREHAQTELSHVSADIDPLAEQKLDSARRALAAIEAELGLESSEPPEARVERLRARVAEVEHELANLPTGDARGVKRALELVRNPPQGGLEPDPEGQQLADAVEAVQNEIVAFEESLAEEGISLAKSLADLEESKAELAEAEARLERREASPEERAELESIRDQMQDLAPKTEARIGGAKAKRQLEELHERQNQMLERLGYRSWTDYVMGSALAGVDPEAKDRVARARIDVEVREERWVKLAERLEGEPAYKEMLDRLEGVYLAAFDLLEGQEPDDPASALRALTIEVPPMSQLDAASELWDALEEAGVELDGDELPFEAIIDAADEWLRAITVAEAAQPRLQQDLVHLEGQLADAEAELAEAEQGMSREPEIPDDPRWAAAMGKVNGAQARYDRYLASKEEIRPLEEQLEAAISAERAAQEHLETRQILVDTASVQERATRVALDAVVDELATDPEVAMAIEADGGLGAGPDPEALDMFLLSALTALRGVSYAGSVPLFLDGVLDLYDRQDALEAMARLERLSDAVQVVVLTEREDIVSWVDGLDIDHAAVVEPGVLTG